MADPGCVPLVAESVKMARAEREAKRKLKRDLKKTTRAMTLKEVTVRDGLFDIAFDPTVSIPECASPGSNYFKYPSCVPMQRELGNVQMELYNLRKEHLAALDILKSALSKGKDQERKDLDSLIRELSEKSLASLDRANDYGSGHNIKQEEMEEEMGDEEENKVEEEKEVPAAKKTAAAGGRKRAQGAEEEEAEEEDASGTPPKRTKRESPSPGTSKAGAKGSGGSGKGKGAKGSKKKGK